MHSNVDRFGVSVCVRACVCWELGAKGILEEKMHISERKDPQILLMAGCLTYCMKLSYMRFL